MPHTGQMKITVILLIIHVTITRTAKNTAPSVYETINEHARIDDKRPLPYGNPLAGNSQQNAKLHAQHQQAMFNAERVRQHRAQIQRWNKAPLQVDSYMKAYHESQENHQLALEQMQTNQKDKKSKSRSERPNLRSRAQLEPIKLTRADAVDKNRNHRSYGSVYYNVHQKNKIYTSPGPTYDQGVTIKPNGNIGLNNLEKEHVTLYTEVIPSKTQYVYPKLYNQMHLYQSADEISALNHLLTKSPQEQVTELNSLTNIETGKDTLQTPIDLFFYLNEPKGVDGKYNVQNSYNRPYAAEHVNYDDYKPIMEDVEDIEEEKASTIKSYPVPQPISLPQIYNEPSPTKSNNYYETEVEQTINGNTLGKNEIIPSQYKPKYAATAYEKPLNLYTQGPSTEGVKYLKPQNSGVQHLSQDGTGVSAYGDDDVSIKERRQKRELDTALFILGNETLPIEDQLIRLENETNFNNKTVDHVELGVDLDEFNVTSKNNLALVNKTSAVETDSQEMLPKPDEWKRYRSLYDSQLAGEASDYNYDEDDPTGKDYSYDGDYDIDYKHSPPDLNYPAQKNFKLPISFTSNRQTKVNQNFDLENSFSNRYAINSAPSNYGPHDSYGNPIHDYGIPNHEYGVSNHDYGVPNHEYGVPNQYYRPRKNKFREPKQQYGPPNQHADISSLIDSLEPIYMLTESQLKSIAGHSVNVQHLDVFQYPSVTKYRKRYPKRIKKHRKNRPRKFGKFRKLHKLIHHHH